jgi:uncharacterized lipoprotein YajG
MKAALVCILLLSGCTSVQPSRGVTPKAEQSTEAAVEATKQFWKVFVQVQSSGDIEPLATVCERESLAWVNARGKLLEDNYKGIVSVNTGLTMSDFRVSSQGQQIVVTHVIQIKGYDASASTRKPLESEQTLPPEHATVELQRFGTKLLVTKFGFGR